MEDDSEFWIDPDDIESLLQLVRINKLIIELNNN
jgi:hypothetical protein